MTHEEKATVALLFIACGCVLGAVCAELYLSLCLNTKMMVISGIVISIAILPLVLFGKRFASWMVYLTFVVAMIAVYVMPWSLRRQFIRDLASIRIGMTEDEANHIMMRYIRGTGWPPPPSFNGQSASTITIPRNGKSDVYGIEDGRNHELKLDKSVVFRYSNDRLHNAEWGVIMVITGHVVSVKYCSD